MDAKPDWRGDLTASGCLKYLGEAKHLTGVKFIFPNDNNESCTGHKLILSMRSAVFEAMFYGPMAKDNDEVTISDIEKNTFEMVLKYMYSDELEVDGDTVLRCLYAANNDCINGMVKMCSDFLEASVAVDNACSNYEHAKLYELHGLLEKCKSFMTTNAEDILKDDDFFSLTNQSLAELLANEQFKPNEVLYFDAANRWSKNECSKRKMEISTESKQTLPGPALREIKVGLMTPQEFAEHVPETGLLNKDDQSDIYRWIITKKLLHGSQVCDKFKSLPRQLQTLPITLNTSNCTEGTTLSNKSRFTIQSNEPIRITSIVMKTSSYQLSSVTVSESEEKERPLSLSNMNVSKTYIFEEDLKVKAKTTVTLKFKFNSMRIKVKHSYYSQNVNHRHYQPKDPEHVFGGLVVNCTEFSEYMSTINVECS